MTSECTIIIPTIKGRDDMLWSVIDEFDAQGFDDIVVVRGFTWGEGINQAIRNGSVNGKRWLTCCDDTVPDVGWHVNAFAMFDAGYTPVVRYFSEAGEPNNITDTTPHDTPMSWTRFFLLNAEIYERCGPLIDATWWADIDYSERMNAIGRELRACDGFRFTHLNPPRDWLTPEQEARDKEAYNESHRRQGLEVTR